MRVTRIAVALLLLVPACAFGDIWGNSVSCGHRRDPGVTVDDILGTYGDSKTGTLVLNRDDTFEADGLARKDHDGDAERRVSGEGRWKLNSRGGIPLTFAHTDETWYRIDVAAWRMPDGVYHVFLYYLYGDIANCEIIKLAQRDPASRRSTRLRPHPAGEWPDPA